MFVAARSWAATGDIDASKYGLDASGGTDVTEPLRAAAHAIPDSGGTLLLPPGQFRISGTIAVKSGTKVLGHGATLVADGGWHVDQRGTTGHSLGYAAIANISHAAVNLTDRSITIQGLSFDYNALSLGTAHAVSFRKAMAVQVLDCTFSGGGNATAMLACQNTLVARCTSHGTLNCAYDHWEGCDNSQVSDCVAVCKADYGILFTAVGTEPADHHRATRFKATNNRIYAAPQAGIWICTLSERSSIDAVVLSGNYVYGGTKGSGIGATGDVGNITIENNTLEAIEGGNAIFIRPDKWHRPHDVQVIGNGMINCVTEDRNVALIEALGDRIVVRGNSATGGSYPSLVWIDGAQCTLANNTGTGARSRLKYRLDKAQAPVVSDP